MDFKYYLSKHISIRLLQSFFSILLATALFLICSISYSQQFEKSYITTDREVYGINDTLWFKGYTFDSFNNISDKSVAFHVLIHDYEGNLVKNTSWPLIYGTSRGQIALPKVEGRYYVKAFGGSMVGGDTSLVFEKEIIVRNEQPFDYLVTQPVETSSKSRGLTMFKVLNQQNQPVENIDLSYEIWQGDTQLNGGEAKTNENGIVSIPVDSSLQKKGFRILTDIEGVEKTLIPFKAEKRGKIDLQLLPEGGNLIANFTNRVAFKAVDENGDPFDFKGILVNANNDILDSINSTYQGMGLFSFIPTADEVYKVKIIEPSRLDTVYRLPKAESSGLTIQLNFIAEKEAVLSVIASSDLDSTQAKLILSKAGVELINDDVQLSTHSTFKIPLVKLPVGIYNIAVISQDFSYASERLLFVHPEKNLSIDLPRLKPVYLARERVATSIQVRDEKGNPVRGQFSITASYKRRSTLKEGSRANLMTQILLESELKGSIPTPDFYFSDHALSLEALNLVMLTHGWRKIQTNPYDDPEAVAGRVINGRRDKRSSLKELNLVSIKKVESKTIPIQESGLFRIPSEEFKLWGDSLLISINQAKKREKSNIQLFDSLFFLKNNFQSEFTKKKPISDQQSIFKNDYKLTADKFQGITIFDGLEVSTSRPSFRNGCSLFETKPEKWTIKERSTLDMTNPELMNLLKQVSPLVKGVGDIKPMNVSPNRIGTWKIFVEAKVIERIILSKNAILSTQLINQKLGINISNFLYFAHFDYNIPFQIYLNCQEIETHFQYAEEFVLSNLTGEWSKPLEQDFYKFYILEVLDLSNLELIAIAESGVYGERPIIAINTIDKKLIRKQSIKKVQFHRTYENIPREFYQPIYDSPEKVNDPVPDSRSLVYWNPNVTTDENGEAEIAFYNADRPQIIEITVEGIGENGSLGIQRYEYTILDKKVSLDKDQN